MHWAWTLTAGGTLGPRACGRSRGGDQGRAGVILGNSSYTRAPAPPGHRARLPGGSFLPRPFPACSRPPTCPPGSPSAPRSWLFTPDLGASAGHMAEHPLCVGLGEDPSGTQWAQNKPLQPGTAGNPALVDRATSLVRQAGSAHSGEKGDGSPEFPTLTATGDRRVLPDLTQNPAAA